MSSQRKRILAAVAQEIVTSEDDDDVADGIDVCNIIKKQLHQRRQKGTTLALHALGESIRSTLLGINEIREKNRERRHRELLQILTKMVQHENATKSEKNESDKLNTEETNNEQHNSKKEYAIDVLESVNFSNTDEIRNKKFTTKIPRNDLKAAEFTEKDLKQNRLESVDAAKNSPLKCIDLLPRDPITNKLQINKIKNMIDNKHIKKQFEKSRAELLELQRKKMEDRERKKLMQHT